MYAAMMGTVFVFCWLGTKLSEQAESVREAAWGCDWVGTPVSFQRCLVFIMASSNKEFTFTAAKFVPVSNKTMMNMMNQTASFFMFLLHIKSKNEDLKQGF
ncbi:odorant receptor 2a-like [Cryptotermes secundus]|uniref:odorant receptor 2a-like n=1 Tax=Cryptotermes secundus TaxID=105785 RepID=UPI001454E016|nr:odorant receptor 2a-like [Cryptotermes secundus]